MKKIKMISFSHTFLWYAFIIFFTALLGLGLVLKSVYDFKGFFMITNLTMVDVLTLSINGAILMLLVRFKDRIEQTLTYKWIFLIFFLAGISYLLLVPLKPFSETLAIWEGAGDFSTFQWDKLINSTYLQTFRQHLDISALFGSFMIFLPKSILSLKFINILCLAGTALFSSGIVRNLKWKYPNIVCCATLYFIPAFLYLNHLDFDIMFLCITTGALYCYTKKQKAIIVTFLLLGVAFIFDTRALLYFLAIMMDYTFRLPHQITINRKLQIGLILSAIFFVIGIGGECIVRLQLKDTKTSPYSIWNQIYDGMDEKQLGFTAMQEDATSETKDMEDVLKRMSTYGSGNIMSLYAQKNFWIWTEGTYEASLYAFGEDTDNYQDKYEYITFLTPYLMRSDQHFRVFITSFCRSQYMIVSWCMLLFVFKKRRELKTIRIFIAVFLLTAAVTTIIELDSKYILHCYPLMMIMASQLLCQLTNIRKRQT